ncbi:MAG: tRNA (guanosine(37)-N1)-methyltransferase TrmD [Desulfobacterales bacterium]|nr:tRNA (guanosine(37)-N1)-methyltransferase TrmD [Desulfobacterales bacterium]
MKFFVITIFPDIFNSFWEHGIIRKAIEEGIISYEAVDIRNFAEGKHHVTDDRPFGGGCGMVMKPEPITKAIRAVQEKASNSKIVFLSPKGKKFNQNIAKELSLNENLIFICGRYEGIDERVYTKFDGIDVSIGDYVLSGGEVAAMVIIDSIARLIPGALGCSESANQDSFSDYLMEYPHYTRPRIFEGEDVPEILLSGNHEKIEKWRYEASLMHTLLKRPDLLENKKLNLWEMEILEKWCKEIDRIIQAQSLHSSNSLSSCE